MAVPTRDLPSTADFVGLRLTGRRTDTGGLAFQGLLLLTLLMSLLFLVVLLGDVLADAVPLLADRGVGDFLGSDLSPRADAAGVWQGLVGSFLIVVFVVVLAFPIGIGAGVYLEEYARDNLLTRLISITVRNLAGVPSVVYGLLGLSVFVQTLDGLTGGRSIISAGLTMAVLVLPIVVITSAEAVRAVPRPLREAGYGVGATRWEVVRSHVLPYAAPGILTGTVLALARALGEAAPLIVIGASTYFVTAPGTDLVDRLQGPFTAMPYVIFNWARQSQAEFRELTSAAILVLLLAVLVANAGAILLRNRYEKSRTA